MGLLNVLVIILLEPLIAAARSSIAFNPIC